MCWAFLFFVLAKKFSRQIYFSVSNYYLPKKKKTTKEIFIIIMQLIIENFVVEKMRVSCKNILKLNEFLKKITCVLKN